MPLVNILFSMMPLYMKPVSGMIFLKTLNQLLLMPTFIRLGIKICILLNNSVLIMNYKLLKQNNLDMKFGQENGHQLLMFVPCGQEDLMMEILLLNLNVNGLTVPKNTYLPIYNLVSIEKLLFQVLSEPETLKMYVYKKVCALKILLISTMIKLMKLPNVLYHHGINIWKDKFSGRLTMKLKKDGVLFKLMTQDG